MQWRRFGN
uniref:Uncharacterized protein n=1 Tax=Arundo donax TaxID=35708 RepID=A0A0A9C3G6_ARUDO